MPISLMGLTYGPLEITDGQAYYLCAECKLRFSTNFEYCLECGKPTIGLVYGDEDEV